MSEIKLSEEEINSIKELKVKYNELALQFGEIKMEMIQLSELESALTNEYKLLTTSEKFISENIQKKYGDGVLDLETGMYTTSQATV